MDRDQLPQRKVFNFGALRAISARRGRQPGAAAGVCQILIYNKLFIVASSSPKSVGTRKASRNMEQMEQKDDDDEKLYGSSKSSS